MPHTTHRRILAVISAALALLMCSCAFAVDGKTDGWLRIMEQGDAALDDLHSREANALFRKALSMLSQDSATDVRVTVTLRYLGDSYLALSDYSQAQKCYEQESRILQRIYPEYPDLAYDYYQLGVIAIENCQFTKANDYLQKSLQIRLQHQRLHEPKPNKIVLNLAIVQALEGNLEAAKKTVQELVVWNRNFREQEGELSKARIDTKALVAKLKLPDDHPLWKLYQVFSFKAFLLTCRSGAPSLQELKDLSSVTPDLVSFCRTQFRQGNLDDAWQLFSAIWLQKPDSNVSKIALLQAAAQRASEELEKSHVQPTYTMLKIQRNLARNIAFVQQHFQSLDDSVHKLDSDSFYLMARLDNNLGALAQSQDRLAEFGKMIEKRDAQDQTLADGWLQLRQYAKTHGQDAKASDYGQHENAAAKKL